MTAFLLIVIAGLLFILSSSLHRKADSYDSPISHNFNPRSKPVQNAISPKTIPHISYWEAWKKNHPSEASVIEVDLERNMADVTDKDAKEIIDAFNRMAHANILTDWTRIKPLMLNKLTEMVDALGKEQSFALLDKAIQQEADHTHAQTKNTGTFIALSWLKQSIEAADCKKMPFSKAIKDSNKCSFMASTRNPDTILSDAEKNEIIGTFIEEYISQIMGTIGENVHIPLFANGYDSPIAREIINIMYSYHMNNEFIEKAKKEGVWNKLMFTIIEETNKITDKYCDADVQECIEYFNFPDKPVVTSRRCTACGSRRVFCEDIGEYECMDCGCQWHAPHGRNTYSRI